METPAGCPTTPDWDNLMSQGHDLIILDPGSKKILRCDENGKVIRVLRDDLDKFPDGVCIDHPNGHIYMTRMGEYDQKTGTSFGFDGSIWRMDMDGSDFIELVGSDRTRTPKQLKLDVDGGKMYWCDREGLKVKRANLDGSDLEVLVSTGKVPDDERDESRWCVGIAIDFDNRLVYWTQKGDADGGKGSVRRAGLDLPGGESPEDRSDIEVLFDNLPEPIDLELVGGYLYWSDRGNLPGGNSVSRASVSADGKVIGKPEIVIEGVGEAIGFVIDREHNYLFVNDISGKLYRSALDGSNLTVLGQFGQLTGATLT